MSKTSIQKKAKNESSISLLTPSVVNYEHGFHFYTAVGDYTGVTAISLPDLAQKLRSIQLESVRFHFERGDFQRWIRTRFYDSELAESLGTIKPNYSDEMLRREIMDKVDSHLARLRTVTSK